MTEADTTGLVDAREVCKMAGISLCALRCRMERDTMPQPSKTINRKYYWERKVIEDWVESMAPPSPPAWPSSKNHVTVRDLAEALGKTTNAVRIMRRYGQLPQPASFAGGILWWDRQVIEQWLKQRRTYAKSV